MEIKAPKVSTIAPIRLLFFLSQILYQSIEFYRTNGLATNEYSLRELADVFPDTLVNIFVLAMLFGLCYGWIVFFLCRRVSLVLDIIQYVGLPLAYMFLPPLNAQLDVGTVLCRIFPIIILTVSTCAKLYFTIFLYHNLYLNELVKADIYYPMFSIVRLCCLTVAKNFISPEALIYVIAALQFMSSAYKYFHIEYYNPEIEWCSTITEIWGWVSVIQWAFLIYGMRFTVLNLAIFAIGLMVYFPSAPMLIILERKVKNVLARAERQRSKQYHILLLTYYVNMHTRGQRKYLTNLWSSNFRLFINSKILEKDCKVGEHFIRMRQKQSMNKVSQLQDQPTYNQFEDSLQVKQGQGVEVKSLAQGEGEGMEQVDIGFIKSTTKEKILPSGKFEASYYVLYLLIDSQLLDPVFIYQIYYQMLELIKMKKLEIQAIEMQGIFSILRQRVSALKFLGSLVEEILQYDELHEYLHKYLQNQKKFYGLLSEIDIDMGGYRTYLDTKIEVKQKISRSMKVLEFMYPNAQSLVMKNYIVERHINNNEILSEERLMININRVNAHKTKMVNFAATPRVNEDCIFLCPFIQNRGQIVHRNKKFDSVLEASNVHRLKMKDILPAFWRDSHDIKVQQISKVQELHQHGSENTYYVQSIVSHRYFEAKQVIVAPYFELQGQMLLVVRLRIDEVKELQIKEVQGNKGKRPIYTNKAINLKSRSSIANMLELEEAERKSRRNIRFQEEELIMYDLEEKTATIFNKMYKIEAKTNYLNINTRNLIQSKLEAKINQDIQAVIQIAATLNDRKLEAIEKNKNINVLLAITLPFALLVMLFSLLFAAGATSISTFFVSYNILISESAIMKLQYYEVSMCITSFIQIFNTFNCGMDLEPVFISSPDYMQKYNKVRSLIQADTEKFIQIYDRHVKFTKQLSKYNELLEPVFKQYNGIDMQPYKENKNIIEHITMMNIMLDSASKLIRSGDCSNWIVRNFYDVINWQGELLFDQSFLEYIVTIETEKVLSNMIRESEVVFWLVQFFNVLSPIFAYIIFWKSKGKIEKVLTKPLFMNQSEKNEFRINFKCIQRYLTKQQTKKEDKGETHPIVPSSTTSLAQKSLCKQGPIYTEKQEKPRDQKGKETRGSFFNYILVIALLVGFHLLTVMVCSKKLFVAKSEFISTLEGKLNKFEEFANFNSQLFIMFNDFLQLVATPQLFTPGEIEMKLQKINEAKSKLNEVEINVLVTKMLIDSSRSKQILFGNPCQYLNLCTTLNRSLSAYPTELSLFFTTFYKLQNLYSNQTYDKLKLSVLLYEAYVSTRSIAEMIFHINSINLNMVSSIISQNDVWIALSYIGFGVFLLIMLAAVSKIIIDGCKYAREILSILPSRILCRAKVLEFEVNCIYYRTNFAKINILL